MPQIILITGNMAAGKSSVAQALAERLPRSVHLRGDTFRRMIVNGRAPMSAELSDAAIRQLHLRYRITAAVAALYADAGFTVIGQDILIGAGLPDILAAYRPYRLALIVLCPDPEVIRAREDQRAKRGYQDSAEIVAFDHILRQETPRLGYWLDSSHMTIDETVDAILANLPQAIVADT
jgi:chloramphenicol 3-O-phosphotransferase